MTTPLSRALPVHRVVWLALAFATVIGPSIAIAQTNAAAMAVRSRLEGASPEGPEGQAPQAQPGPGSAPGQVSTGASSSPDGSKLDSRYLSPNAGIIAVVRPSQILSTPIAQMLPVEIVTAYLGFDPAEIEDITVFVDPLTAGMGYGATFHFKNPVRATAIPPERRSHVQLAELSGKKYLHSPNPMMYSIYAPNNRTIIAATDAALKQLLATAGQPKIGPAIDRIRDVPAGSDLYLSVDGATLQTFIPMALAMRGINPAQAPPAVKEQLESLSLISSVELILNISNPAPSSLVVRCADDAAAQKFEAIVQQAKQKMAAGPQAEQGAGSAMLQAAGRYKDRLLQLCPMQREGNNFAFFRTDGQNPAQQQFVSAFVVMSSSIGSLAYETMSKTPRPPGPGVVGPAGGPGALVPPGGPAAPPSASPHQ